MTTPPSPATPSFRAVRGYLAHKKQRPRRALQYDSAYGPMVVLGDRAVFYKRGTPVVPNLRRRKTRTQGYPAHTKTSSRRTLQYRGTSLIRKRTPLGPYSRPMPRVLGWW